MGFVSFEMNARLRPETSMQELYVDADISSYTSFKEAQFFVILVTFFNLSVSTDVRYLTVHDKCN